MSVDKDELVLAAVVWRLISMEESKKYMFTQFHQCLSIYGYNMHDCYLLAEDLERKYNDEYL